MKLTRIWLPGYGYIANPGNNIVEYNFNASWASPVYKNDIDTVQPPSVVVKYIIKAE